MALTMRQGVLDREVELATLDAAVGRVAAGDGRVVLIEGSAGVGKSTLLAAVRENARAAGLRVLGARGGELEREFAFGVIRQLYESALISVDDHERSRLLAGWAAPAAWVLGLSDDGSGVHAAGYAAMHAIYWLTVQLANDQPVVLSVDDLHWADASSLRALDYLARRIPELPVLLVLALRPDEPGTQHDLFDALRANADATRVSVGPLGTAAVAGIVRFRIPDASDEVCEACRTVTSGNALYLEELLRAVTADGEAVDPQKVALAAVPSLGDRVLRRAVRVSADAPALARAMAVLGDGARLAVAAELAGVEGSSAARIAHQLRRIEVLAEEDPFTFVHPLVRRSVYDAIPEAERQPAHAAAAGLLKRAGSPPESVAAQLRELAPNGSSSVAEALLAAGERALGRAAPDEAVRWLNRALVENASEPRRLHLLSRLALAKGLQRDPAAVAHLREAFMLAEDPALRVRLAVELAELLGHAGRWNDSLAMIESIERELGDAELELETEAAAIRAVVTLHDPEHIADFDARRDRYVWLAGGEFWASRALAALLSSEAAYRGRPREAVAFNAQAREGGLLLRERGGGAWTPSLLLGALIEAEDFETLPTAVEEVASAARVSGSTFALVSALGLRGWAHARRGELGSAAADIEAALELAENADLIMGVTSAAFFLIDVLLERADQERLAELVEQTELPPDFLRTTSGAHLLEARGQLRILRRDRDRGIEDLRSAGQIYRALRFGPAHSTWRSALALALTRAQFAEARELAAEEADLAQATGLARPLGIALRTLGVLDDGADAIDLLTQSVEVLESSAARLEHARSLIELGSCLRRDNQRARARAPLAQGLELAYACGATRLTERAQQELRAAGGRRRRVHERGSDALTASELRVVKLAASGAANTEIAQELFISLKTVETHLTRAYAKLGLAGTGSRMRLARALDTAGA